MRTTPDGEGRYPMTFEEYTALRNLFGALGCIDCHEHPLEDRANLTDGTWQKLQDAQHNLAEALTDIVKTVPRVKLQALSRELNHMHLEAKTTKPKRDENWHGITYVDQIPLERVIDKAVSMECFCCDRCGAEVGKCRLRQDIEALYHYDFGRDWKNGCPLAGGMAVQR